MAEAPRADCRPTSSLVPALYGLIRLGGMPVALPAQAIREVVACPPALHPFPALIPQVAGAIELRGQSIPVLDLQQIVGIVTEPAPAERRIVVVLASRDRIIGVLADGIDGVVSLRGDATGDFACATEQLRNAVVRSSFVHERLVGIVIDPQALLDIPGLPAAQGRTARLSGEAEDGEPALEFQIGGLRCALPAACVDATLPRQKLLASPVTDGLWIAMLQHNGFEIPVVDTLALLSHGSLGVERGSSGAIVLRCASPGEERHHGLVALPIDSVDDIVRIRSGMVAPLVEGLVEAPFAKGVIELASGPCLLLDGERLVADPRLAELATIRQCSASNVAMSARQNGSVDTVNKCGEPEAFLVFSAHGADLATPLGCIEEILWGAAQMVSLDTQTGNLVGLLPHRGQSVPVIDLRRVLGDCSPPPAGFLMIVRGEAGVAARPVGFLVDGLRSVERAVPQRLEPLTRPTGLAAVATLDATIRLNVDRACSIVQLPALAARLLP